MDLLHLSGSAAGAGVRVVEMSRSCYSDDYGDEFPGQLALYRGNVDRSIGSKKGQARLIELRDALLAMPVKALEADVFVRQSTGEACALGVWAQRHLSHNKLAQLDVSGDSETADALELFKWPRLVVMDVIYANDSDHWVSEPEAEGPHRSWDRYRGHYDHESREWVDRWPVVYRRRENPTERYQRVLAWVNEHIQEPQP